MDYKEYDRLDLQALSQEDQEQVRDDLKDLVTSKGWAARCKLFNEILYPYELAKQQKTDLVDIYRAQGAVKALSDLHNTIVDEANKEISKEE